MNGLLLVGFLLAAHPLTTTPVPHRDHRPMRLALLALAVGQAADAWTTHAALARGGAERNPFYGRRPSLARVVGMKASVMVPIAWLLDHHYSRKPKTAVGLSGLLGAVGAGLAVHNARQ